MRRASAPDGWLNAGTRADVPSCAARDIGEGADDDRNLTFDHSSGRYFRNERSIRDPARHFTAAEAAVIREQHQTATRARVERERALYAALEWDVV